MKSFSPKEWTVRSAVFYALLVCGFSVSGTRAEGTCPPVPESAQAPGQELRLGSRAFELEVRRLFTGAPGQPQPLEFGLVVRWVDPVTGRSRGSTHPMAWRMPDLTCSGHCLGRRICRRDAMIDSGWKRERSIVTSE